jgi:hypothetical protein
VKYAKPQYHPITWTLSQRDKVDNAFPLEHRAVVDELPGGAVLTGRAQTLAYMVTARNADTDEPVCWQVFRLADDAWLSGCKSEECALDCAARALARLAPCSHVVN